VINDTKWPVRLSAAAETDFQNIVRWTFEHFGERQARKRRERRRSRRQGRINGGGGNGGDTVWSPSGRPSCG